MIVYALVSSESDDAIALFLARKNAERRLVEALADEPGWQNVLSIEVLDFAGGHYLSRDSSGRMPLE